MMTTCEWCSCVVTDRGFSNYLQRMSICNAHYSSRKKQKTGEGTEDDVTLDKDCTDEVDTRNSNDDIGAE